MRELTIDEMEMVSGGSACSLAEIAFVGLGAGTVGAVGGTLLAEGGPLGVAVGTGIGGALGAVAGEGLFNFWTSLLGVCGR